MSVHARLYSALHERRNILNTGFNRATLELHRTPVECVNHRRAFDLKGMTMKRFAIVVCAATVAMSASSAFAQFPSSANETTSFASEFPNIVTYADLHRNDVAKQASSSFPSSANE